MGKTISLDKYPAEIVEERYNPLIKRLEVQIRVTHLNEGTPSRGILKKAIASYYGKNEKLVVIREVKTEYGLHVSTVKAHLYDSEDRLRLFEPEYLLKRDEESLAKIQAQQG